MSNLMTNCTGFEFVARDNARVLILGSLPGAESLKKNQYYAKKQNSFWKIMGELIGATTDLSYEVRLEHLKKNRIALWDVCASAERIGSLDSHIQSPTPNDFASFFKSHRSIKLICFNGQTAQKLFQRYVSPDLPEKFLSLPQITLPSTSPAHAGMTFDQKLLQWHEALCTRRIK